MHVQASCASDQLIMEFTEPPLGIMNFLEWLTELRVILLKCLVYYKESDLGSRERKPCGGRHRRGLWSLVCTDWVFMDVP